MTATDALHELVARRISRAAGRLAGDPAPDGPGDPVDRPGAGRTAVLSDAQRRLWFLDRYQPGSPVYVVPAAFRLDGPLRREILQEAVAVLVRRHESLRTTFPERDGQPVQEIAADGSLDVALVDLRGLAAADRDRRVRELAGTAGRPPFDLRRGPLLRAELLVVGPQQHVLLLQVHHIVVDGWSLSLLVHELAEVYRALAAAEPPRLDPRPLQFADLAARSAERIAPGLSDDVEFWRRELADVPPLELPTDRARPPVQSGRGGRCAFTVAPEPARRADELAAATGCTPFTVLLAAFELVLHRYSRQDVLAVGVPVANRTDVDAESTVGCVTNTVVVRSALPARATVREFVLATRDAAVASFDHQHVPFELLVERLRPERDPGRQPLYQAMFVLQNVPPFAEVAMGDVRLTALPMVGDHARCDVAMALTHDGGPLRGEIEYSADLFDAATAQRMAGHFATVLAAMVDRPDAPVADLPMLTAAEHHDLVVARNSTEQAFGVGFLHEVVARHARRTPDALALVVDREQIGYRDLDRRANALAHRLVAWGVAPETPVGLCLGRSAEMVVAILAVLKAGGAFVPLDPAYPAERLAHMVSDTGAPVLLTTRELRGRFVARDARIVCLDDADERAALAGGVTDTAPDVALAPDNAAFVIYTSGSTGPPKGVVVPHRGVFNVLRCLATTYGYTVRDRVLQFASFSFDASVCDLLQAWCEGGSLHVASEEQRLSPVALAELIGTRRLTVVTLPPSVLAALPERDLPELRLVFSTAEACSAAVVARWSRGRRFVNAYGPTETTIGATFGENGDRAEDTPNIGRPWSNMRVYVVDGMGALVPDGVPGELWIGGPGVARGYVGRGGATAERFVPDPFGRVPGARLYRTGDLVRWGPGGLLEFVGRVDRQVKVRGHRIELGEIEETLRSYPVVSDAAVVVRGSGEDRSVVAFVVPTGAVLPTAGELRRHAADRLPRHMVPTTFALLDGLPLTPNGKVDRRDLERREVRAAPRDEEHEPPATPVERAVTRVWEQVLGTADIGVHDNFFDLGGHSMLALGVQRGLLAELDRDVPVVALFRYPTVRSLATFLDRPGDDGRTAHLGRERADRRRAALRRRPPAVRPAKGVTS